MTADRDHSVLVLCSANRCRSPMGAALLGRRLAAAGWRADVSSAGFGPADLPAVREAAQVVGDDGLDITTHRSRRVDGGLLTAADLVICMTRQHLVDVAVLEPGAWPRTFTLIELVQRAEQCAPVPPMAFEQWVRLVHGGRSRRDVMAYSSAYDVEDPIGKPLRAFESTLQQIDGLSRRLVAVLPAPPAA